MNPFQILNPIDNWIKYFHKAAISDVFKAFKDLPDKFDKLMLLSNEVMEFPICWTLDIWAME